MKWKLRLSRQADKFIKRHATPHFEKNLDKVIVRFIQKVVHLAPANIDLKAMKGEWNGYYRIRQGDLRIILSLDYETNEIVIYRIGWRGDVYK